MGVSAGRGWQVVERIGVVVAGAGARGAYEAGVLAELVPRMERAGEAPDVFVGTSAGALNAVLLAAFAGGPPPNVPPELALRTTADALRAFWSRLGAHQVWRPLLRDAPRLLWHYGGGGLIRGGGLTSLLHTGPLSRTAERWSWALDAAREKIAGGRVQALAVATTDVYRGRTVVFVERAPGVALPRTDQKRAIDYVETELTTDHLVASAAIPVAFPAVALRHPDGGSRWYSDGGVRLNAPLKPALALGADRLVVVATHPADAVEETAHAPDHLQPEVDDQLVNVLEAVLVDRMIEDLWTLRKINAALRQSSRSAPSASGPGERRGAGERPGPDERPGSGRRRRYHEFPYVFVGPPERDTLGRLADRVFAGFGPLRRLQPDVADLSVLRRLLASGAGPRAGDPLSYLFFHPSFAEAAFTMGAEDAARVAASARTAVTWSL
jgi:NTE family protein